MAHAPAGKNRVCYFYDNEIGNYYYGQGHPMKPHRIRMAHNLLLNYGLYRKMEIYVRASPALPWGSRKEWRGALWSKRPVQGVPPIPRARRVPACATARRWSLKPCATGSAEACGCNL